MNMLFIDIQCPQGIYVIHKWKKTLFAYVMSNFLCCHWKFEETPIEKDPICMSKEFHLKNLKKLLLNLNG